MTLFLYGPDTYRSRQKLNEIIERHTKGHKAGLDLVCYDCEKLIFQDLIDEIQQSSLFKSKKLIVLENPFSDPNFKRKFLENSKKFIDSSNTIIFYASAQILQRDSLFTFLKKEAKTQEFKLLEGQNLKNWIRKEAEKYQCQISELAIVKLAEFIGNNLWQASNEIKKIATFKNRQKIEEKDVELLVKPKIESDIFKTIDAISSKNKKQALSLINKHLEKGDNPLYLLSMMHFQIRNLLVIKNLIESRKPYNAILKESGLHPFVVRKNYLQAGKFTFQELKKIYQRIFQIDFNIKRGKIEPKIALDLLIAEI